MSAPTLFDTPPKRTTPCSRPTPARCVICGRPVRTPRLVRHLVDPEWADDQHHQWILCAQCTKAQK